MRDSLKNGINFKDEGKKNYGSTKIESSSVKGIRLKKEIGLFEGIGVIVGAIVGSGLFISPKGITEYAGSVALSLIIWAASGIISTIGAICYAELGTTFTESGADYSYLLKCFGPLPAFLNLWATVMIFIPVNYAILALVCAEYIMQPFFALNVDLPVSAVRLLAAVLICFLIFLNCYDVKITAKLQNVFTVGKISALLVIVITGFIALLNGRTENYKNSFANSKYDPGSIALAFYSGIYAFGGANSLNYMTEELQNPNKNLPRAIYISLALVTVIYILVNTAYFSVISPDLMVNGGPTGIIFAEKLLGKFNWILPVFVAISTFGGLSVGIMISSRVLFVGSRVGHFPQALALIKLSRLTPTPSLVFIGLTSLIYLATGEIYNLINYAGFLYASSGAAVISGLVYMRWKQPQLDRPIKINLVIPIVYLIISIFLFLTPIYVAPWEFGIGCALVLSGLPIYYLIVQRKEQPKIVQKFNRHATIFVQKLFMAVPED